MSSLRKSIVANFGGQAWAMVMGIAFVPVYIDVLGIEAYGLIGLFLSLQAFFLVLDMGLSTTLNRELARHIHVKSSADQIRNLVRTLEWLYWPSGVAVAVAIYGMSGPLSEYWLQPVSLSEPQTARAISIMGIAAALQWPCGLYSGGLRGQERHVLINALNACFATLRSLGSVAIIWFVSPTIEAFLWWHAFVGALQSAIFGSTLWRLLPTGSTRPSFQFIHLRQVRNFALGMSGIVALSFILMQSDRVILSRVLPLDEFGGYVLAATVAAALSSVIHPFFSALYPRYSHLVAANENRALRDLYHQTNQMLIVVVSSVASVLAFFSEDVLRLWTGNSELAQQTAPVLSILVVGSALNGLMNLPFAMQLAHGWTRLSLQMNLAAVTLIIPTMWYLAAHFGGVGAASAWLLLNLGYLTIGIPLMHQTILTGEMKEWYMTDLLPPALAATGTAGIARMLAPQRMEGIGGVMEIALIGCACLLISSLFSPRIRRGLHEQWAARFS